MSWILAAWESLSKEMIRESFVSCAITCATGGSLDDGSTCFKEGKPCHEGQKLLRELSVDEADVDSANPEILAVEEDDDDDEDGDVEIYI